MATKECESKCPNCGSLDINWYDMDDEDEFIIHCGECEDCETVFQEYYQKVYDRTEWEEET